MTEIICRVTGCVLRVADDRVEKRLAAGYRLAADVKKAESTDKPKTAKRRTRKKAEA